MKKIVNILHDLVEDTDWNFEDLQRAGNPTRIIDALRCVTKLSEKEPYGCHGKSENEPVGHACKDQRLRITWT